MEGFRWPWLTQILKRLNRQRLSRIEKQVEAKNQEYEVIGKQIKSGNLAGDEMLRLQNQMSRIEDRQDILQELHDDYPKDPNGNANVERPTRLANIIASYELYAETRYGIDGTYFWYHILALSDEAARTRFLERSNNADTQVLISAAGAVVSIIGLCFLMGILVGEIAPRLIILHTKTTILFGWANAFGGLFISLIFYRLALPAHRDVAESYRALLDLTMPKFLKWLKKAPNSKPDQKRLSLESKVRLYLGSLEY